MCVYMPRGSHFLDMLAVVPTKTNNWCSQLPFSWKLSQSASAHCTLSLGCEDVLFQVCSRQSPSRIASFGESFEIHEVGQ